MPLAETMQTHEQNSNGQTMQNHPPVQTRRDKLLFFANLLLLIAAMGLSVEFFVWRQDKPTGNPGGPLRGMGGAVLFWEWFALAPGPMLCAWSLGNILRFLGKSIKARYGEPPPLSEEELARVSRRDGFIAAGCFIVVLCIAAYIVFRPPHGWREELVFALLIVISLPFSFGILPPVRKETARWVRWIAKQRGKAQAN